MLSIFQRNRQCNRTPEVSAQSAWEDDSRAPPADRSIARQLNAERTQNRENVHRRLVWKRREKLKFSIKLVFFKYSQTDFHFSLYSWSLKFFIVYTRGHRVSCSRGWVQGHCRSITFIVGRRLSTRGRLINKQVFPRSGIFEKSLTRSKDGGSPGVPSSRPSQRLGISRKFSCTWEFVLARVGVEMGWHFCLWRNLWMSPE